MNLRAGLLAVVIFVTGCLAAPAFAQSSSVTLAWDPNPDSSVAGYIVYVGTTSGSYDESYDVGHHTSFTYPAAAVGRAYFFAVAAYAAESGVGALSAEVVFHGERSISQDPEPITPAASSSTAAPALLCPDRAARSCFDVAPLATVSGDASSLTALEDGRLLFVEDGRRIRTIDGDLLLSEPALSPPRAASTRIAGLVRDPDFDRNRFIYVGEIDITAAGSREMTIVRYREVANVLGEGAAIVTGLPLPSTGGAPFTVDSEGRIYVAVPAEPPGHRSVSPYAGMVLRFENDGSISRTRPGGSPVFAQGWSHPTALIWSESRNELWLAGRGTEWNGPLARLSLSQQLAEWPAVPRAVPTLTDSEIVELGATRTGRGQSRTTHSAPDVIFVNRTGQVLAIVADTAAVSVAEQISATDLGGKVTSAALGTQSTGNDIYVVLTVNASEAAGRSSHIIRLRRR